ncbi:MAG: cren protein [Desulfurococcales archaeon]|nr:cren protein [Desulfurococcales archaeon]
MDDEGVKKAVMIRVSSLGDLARLASSMASRMFIMPVYRYHEGGKSIYFIQTIYKDYYKQYGLPIVYYYEAAEETTEPKYILARADETGERVELSDRVRTGWIAIPVINIAEKPRFLP